MLIMNSRQRGRKNQHANGQLTGLKAMPLVTGR